MRSLEGQETAPTAPILTLVEVARLLRVADKTVYSMAQNGELPCFKVRGQWRFRRVDLDEWMSAQVEVAANVSGTWRRI